jgi:hypothetical protein
MCLQADVPAGRCDASPKGRCIGLQADASLFNTKRKANALFSFFTCK